MTYKELIKALIDCINEDYKLDINKEVVFITEYGGEEKHLLSVYPSKNNKKICIDIGN